MATKSSASYPRERLKSRKSEDIGSRKWTKEEKKALRRIAKRQEEGDDSAINFKEIPPLTPAQLAKMTLRRDRRPKVAVSVRLDARVVDWLKSKGEGHLTRINDILSNIMDMERG